MTKAKIFEVYEDTIHRTDATGKPYDDEGVKCFVVGWYDDSNMVWEDKAIFFSKPRAVNYATFLNRPAYD